MQKSIGEQLGSAFVHGSASAIISNRCYQTIDVLMNGNLSDIGICYTAYLDEGLSEEEAWNRTEKDFAEQEFRNAMAGGFLATGYAAIHLHSNGEKTVKAPKMDDYDEPLGLQKTARSAADESGSKTVDVNGKSVIMDSSIFDPNFVDKQGRTNVQRMEQGLAPIGTDGKSVNIHHIDQTNNGTVMEITATEHQQNYSKLHTNIGQSPSQINRTEFNRWRREYWEWRSHNLD